MGPVRIVDGGHDIEFCACCPQFLIPKLCSYDVQHCIHVHSILLVSSTQYPEIALKDLSEELKAFSKLTVEPYLRDEIKEKVREHVGVFV